MRLSPYLVLLLPMLFLTAFACEQEDPELISYQQTEPVDYRVAFSGLFDIHTVYSGTDVWPGGYVDTTIVGTAAIALHDLNRLAIPMLDGRIIHPQIDSLGWFYSNSLPSEVIIGGFQGRNHFAFDMLATQFPSVHHYTVTGTRH
jgi:hypothetical protein